MLARNPTLNPILQVVCRSIATVFALTLFAAVLPLAHAGVVVDIEDISVISDGVNPTTGEISVLISLTGDDATSPPEISAFDLDFTFVDATVTPGTPQAGNAPYNFGNFDSSFSAGQLVRVTDFLGSGSVTGADGVLTTVPFTIPAGVNSGKFDVNFNTPFNFTNVSDPQFNDISSDPPLNGSIEVQTIPEPYTVLLGLFGACAGLLLRR